MSLRKIIGISVIGIILTMLSGCPIGNETRASGEAARDDIAARASKAVPVPHISNFQNRKAIAEYMKRMDDPNKTFYVYLLGYNGRVIGYYVTRTHPVSVCELMTPPEEEVSVLGSGANPLGSAPTLNGTYGSGNGACGHYYAFTADTDTLVEFSTHFFISDAPLNIETDNGKIAAKAD